MGLTVAIEAEEVTILRLFKGMKKLFGLRKRETKRIILIKASF